METGSPSITKIATMVLFALSCVGLLLFLWLSFGGTIPFAAQGYRFKAAFPDSSQLAQEADVRIAGVNVGKVIAKQLDPHSNRTLVTMQINNQFAPIHKDAKAILRTKTILGETYVQLTPGSANSQKLPDGGTLRPGQVVPAVQLDTIFNALDPPTRRAFQVWQQQLAVAVKGNDQNLSSVLGNLPHFAADTTDLLQVLDVQHTSVVSLLRNGGTVFNAIDRSQSALRNLITSGETTFATTAANNNAIAATFHVFPTFLNETKKTMVRLQNFALDTNPLIKELVPVADQLTPTLHDLVKLAPPLRSFFDNLGPLITVSKTGLPAVRDVINGATPLLGAVGPFLSQLNPILTWLSQHQQLTSDFLGNLPSGIAAKTTSFSGGTGHYLRQFQPIGPETLSINPQRNPQNRGNTYPPPLWLSDPKAFSAGGKFPGSFALPAWDCNNTGAPGDGSQPASGGNTTLTALATPACWVAPPLGPLIGQPNNKFPHIGPATYSNK